jgi:hypothetical protein
MKQVKQSVEALSSLEIASAFVRASQKDLQ